MNRDLLYLTQRIVSAATSALVYIAADKIAYGRKRPYYYSQSKRNRQQNYYQKRGSYNKRPYVKEQREYLSMQEQRRKKK